MCDTIFATPAATAERNMLFGKNSYAVDRGRSGQTATAFFCSTIDHEQFLAHDCRASGRLRRGQQFLLRLRDRPSRRITLDGEYVP
jgi:hypothetical protein